MTAWWATLAVAVAIVGLGWWILMRDRHLAGQGIVGCLLVLVGIYMALAAAYVIGQA